MANNPKRNELLTFLALSMLLVPVISIGLVGGIGLLIWLKQMVFGLPVG